MKRSLRQPIEQSWINLLNLVLWKNINMQMPGSKSTLMSWKKTRMNNDGPTAPASPQRINMVKLFLSRLPKLVWTSSRHQPPCLKRWSKRIWQTKTSLKRSSYWSSGKNSSNKSRTWILTKASWSTAQTNLGNNQYHQVNNNSTTHSSETSKEKWRKQQLK